MLPAVQKELARDPFLQVLSPKVAVEGEVRAGMLEKLRDHLLCLVDGLVAQRDSRR